MTTLYDTTMALDSFIHDVEVPDYLHIYYTKGMIIYCYKYTYT